MKWHTFRLVRCVVHYLLPTSVANMIRIAEVWAQPALRRSRIPNFPSLTECNVSLTEYNVSLTEYNVSLTEGNVSLTEGNVSLTEYNVSLTQCNVSLTEGDVSLGACNAGLV